MAKKRRRASGRKNRKKRKSNWLYSAFIILMLFGIVIFINEHWLHSSFIPSLSNIYQSLGIIKRPKVEVQQDEIAVHFIDVGQADCAVIITPDKTMLIDSGEYETASDVISYLRDFGVERLDYVIGTHPHSDHMGAMAKILNEFEVGEFIMPEVSDELIPTTSFYTSLLDVIERKDIKASYSENGRTIELCEGTSLEFLGPVGSCYEDLNNYSVIAKLTSGNISFLFTGDMEKEAEKELVAQWVDLRADVLKVGHHGASSSSTLEFLARVAPEYGVISVGIDNAYGHPSEAALKRLKAVGCKALTTMIYGDIVFITDGNSLRYTTTNEIKEAA